MPGTLVIVPCGAAKVWTKHPDAGPTPAKDTYTGTPFRVNRAFAEAMGDSWVILSAKYGFLTPDSVIPGPYNVTFNDRKTGPLGVVALRFQVKAMRLDQFARVVGLGGKEYRRVLKEAFGGLVEVDFPFEGLNLFEMIRATAEATRTSVIVNRHHV